MRWIVFALLLGVLVAASLRLGDSLDDKRVRDFYQQVHLANQTLDDKRLCAMLADDFQMSMKIYMDTQQKTLVAEKDDWCNDSARSMEKSRQLLKKIGQHVNVDYSQTIVSVDIAPDKSSAVVKLRSTLQLPGMRMTSRYQDTLTRQQWRTRIQRTEGVTWIGPSYR